MLQQPLPRLADLDTFALNPQDPTLIEALLSSLRQYLTHEECSNAEAFSWLAKLSSLLKDDLQNPVLRKAIEFTAAYTDEEGIFELGSWGVSATVMRIVRSARTAGEHERVQHLIAQLFKEDPSALVLWGERADWALFPIPTEPEHDNDYWIRLEDRANTQPDLNELKKMLREASNQPFWEMTQSKRTYWCFLIRKCSSYDGVWRIGTEVIKCLEALADSERDFFWYDARIAFSDMAAEEPSEALVKLYERWFEKYEEVKDTLPDGRLFDVKAMFRNLRIELERRKHQNGDVKINFDDFWAPLENAETIEPASPESLAALEQAFSVKLPDSYVKVMRMQNGGALKRPAIQANYNSWARNHLMVGKFLAVDPEAQSAIATRLNLPERVVPIAYLPDQDQCVFALDCRAEGQAPRVVFFDSDPEIGVMEVAESFDDFMTLLVDASLYEMMPSEIESLMRYFSDCVSSPLRAELLRLVSGSVDPIVMNRALRQALFKVVNRHHEPVLGMDTESGIFLKLLVALVLQNEEKNTPEELAARMVELVGPWVDKPFFSVQRLSRGVVDKWLEKFLATDFLALIPGRGLQLKKGLLEVEEIISRTAKTMPVNLEQRIEWLMESGNDREVIEGVRMLSPDDRTVELMTSVAWSYNNLQEYAEALLIIRQIKEGLSDDLYIDYLKAYAEGHLEGKRAMEEGVAPNRLVIEQAYRDLTFLLTELNADDTLFREDIETLRSHYEQILVDFDAYTQDMLAYWRTEAGHVLDEEMLKGMRYDSEEFQGALRHIQRYIGPVTDVIGMHFSDDAPELEVKFAVVAPTAQRPEYTLVTLGLGGYKMTVPPEYSHMAWYLERCELIMSVPRSWNPHSPNEIWPYMILRVLMYVMYKQGLWLAYGGIFEWGKEIAPITPFTGAALLMPQGNAASEVDLINRGRAMIAPDVYCNFFSVIPLLPDECAWIIDNNKRVVDLGLKYCVDPKRASFVPKKKN